MPGNRLWGPGPRAQITAEHLEDDDHYTELLEDVKEGVVGAAAAVSKFEAGGCTS